MRPYTFQKDQDGKYIQPSIAQANVIQPSPLALLAATCSKIGQTVSEDVRSYSQGKGDSVELTRSCSDHLKSSPFIYLDRSSDSFKPSPPLAPAGVPPAYFRVKEEQIADYNQNYEEVHICPNVIHESRLLESQRGRLVHGCGHRTRVYPSSCEHGSENHEYFTNTVSTSCEQARNTRRQPNEHQNFNSATVAEQFGMPDQGYFVQSLSSSQTSSCAYENQGFQGSALAHLPSASSACSVTDFEQSQQSSFGSQGDKPVDINGSWYSSLRDIRESDVSVSGKSSCMLLDRTEVSHLHHMPPTSQISSSRHSLSHANTPVQPSLAATTPAICHQPFFSGQPNLSPGHDMREASQSFRAGSSQPSPNFHSYPGYHSPSVDVKVSSSLQHPQHNFRAPSRFPYSPSSHPTSPGQLMNASMYPANLQQESHQKWRQPPQLNQVGVRQHPSPTDQVSSMMAADALNLRLQSAGTPVPMNDFCGSCSPPPPMHPDSPTVLPSGPGLSHPSDLHGQALSEYQYQQQQMYYARDNRRPRRIACTCPNCREGDNRTVTTKDGKQRKLHVCHVPGCGKIYGKTSHLRAHLRWHAGERPFACNWLFCNKRFTRSDELQRHRRTHTGDKRFQCRTCLKKFMRSDHLSKHMKTHLTPQKSSKVKDDSDSSSDIASASPGNSETGDLGSQLRDILTDSLMPPTST